MKNNLFFLTLCFANMAFIAQGNPCELIQAATDGDIKTIKTIFADKDENWFIQNGRIIDLASRLAFELEQPEHIMSLLSEHNTIKENTFMWACSTNNTYAVEFLLKQGVVATEHHKTAAFLKKNNDVLELIGEPKIKNVIIQSIDPRNVFIHHHS